MDSMNGIDPACRPVRERFTAYLDRSLRLDDRRRIDAHLAGCAACADDLRLMRALLEALDGVPPPAPPAGYRERFSARLAAEPDLPRPRPGTGRPRRVRFRTGRNPRWAKGATAAVAGVAAAGLVLAVLFSAPEPPGPAPGPRAQAVAHIPQGGDAVVEIWFDAARAVDNVRFTVRLPDGVRLVSDGRMVAAAEFSWEGSLNAGPNVISLPVRGVARGEWTVTAGLHKGDGHKETSLPLVVNGA
jgi:anti-sigma factor RsiW